MDEPAPLPRSPRQFAREGAWFVAAWAIVAAGSTAVAALVALAFGSALHRANVAVTLAAHATATDARDVVALALTWWGRDLGVGATVVVVIAILHRARRRIDAAVMVPLAVGGVALVATLKAIFHEPRPNLFHTLRPERSFSFPSGHACSATWLYGYILVLALGSPLPGAVRRAIVSALVVLGIAIAWSRVYLGGHWISDEIGGAAIGAAWLAVCLRRRATLTHRR